MSYSILQPQELLDIIHCWNEVKLEQSYIFKFEIDYSIPYIFNETNKCKEIFMVSLQCGFSLYKTYKKKELSSFCRCSGYLDIVTDKIAAPITESAAP